MQSTWSESWTSSEFITTKIAFISRSVAVLQEKDLANRRPPMPSLITTLGGTIAAVCSRCRSQRNLRIRHGHGRVQHASVVRADENEHQSRWAHVTATRACIVGCLYWSRPAAVDRACPRDHGCARRQAHRSRGDGDLSVF